MNAYDFVHLALLAMGGEIQGKTKLQKTVYFLGKLTGALEDLGYRAHFYGPYSSEVAGAIGRLRSLGFVDQTTAGGGAYDERGIEVSRYDFVLNEQGRRVAQEKATRYPDLWQQIEEAAGRLKKAGDLDYLELSIAAKTDFMLGRHAGNKAKVKELSEAAKRFGWDVKAQDVSKAAQFLQNLGLVRIVSDN